MGRQIHLFFGHKKNRIEFNIEMKHYRRKLYEAFADLTA